MPTRPLQHGGRLAEAMARHPRAPRPWLDLSTGINPVRWRGAFDRPDLGRLPDPTGTAELEAAAARAFGVAADRVAAVAGAEAGLRLLPQLIPARRIAIASPTYGSHADAWRLSGAAVAEVERGRLAETDVDALGIVNPNNPDGAVTSPEALSAMAGDRWLIVDESFVEVSPEISVVRCAGPRTVVLRSFGKFYGLPGVRLGFVVAAPEIADQVRRRTGDWPVGADAIALGRAAYADRPWAEQTRARLSRDAARLDRLLAAAGFDILGGTSLFRLTRSSDAERLALALAERGILVRPFADQPTWLRFGLPGRRDWRRLESALTEIRS